MSLKEAITEKGKRIRYLAKLVASNYHCDRPDQVDIELSNRCNLRCKMCWFHGESGIGDRYQGKEFKTDEVLGLVDQLAELYPGLKIYIGGTEPFVRRDFLTILRHIKRRGLGASFTTNGTLMESEDVEALVALGIDCISFSIDGYEELHDGVRGKGVFSKATQAVKSLSRCKLENGAWKPTITINTTVTRQLMGHLQESLAAIKAATDDGADFYRIHHQWFVSSDELSAHQSGVRDKLGCGAAGAAGHLLSGCHVPDPRALADEIESLRSEPKVKMFPDLDHAGIVDYYSDNPRFDRRCFAPFLSVVIKPNGNVTFCPDEWIDDYVIGNVHDQCFDEIWNSEKARKFRSVLMREKHFDGCKRCSWMYSYEP